VNWFSATNASDGVVSASREKVWAVLTDPEALADMTPMLQRIDADGDLWRWQFASIPLLGVALRPSFTERMRFSPGRRIDFEHEPPAGRTERAGVDGWYTLTDVADGTHLAISFTVRVQLPLSRVLAPAVTGVMHSVMRHTGDGFAKNFERRLGEPT
jgi:carbon monoxide dehydrogenase subunit G